MAQLHLRHSSLCGLGRESLVGRGDGGDSSRRHNMATDAPAVVLIDRPLIRTLLCYLRGSCDVGEGVLVISVIDDFAIDRALQLICDAVARWTSCYALRDSWSVS